MEKTEGKIRYGLIGIGAQGGSYARFLTNAPAPFPGMVCAPCPDNCALGALCDIDPEKEKMCKEQYPDVPFFKDWKDMIASGTVDAIITTVPHYLHHEISIYAMEHGMNVLCEKPAGVRSKDVQKMIACAKAHPEVSFGIMFNQRTNKLYQKIKEIVASGELGEIRRSQWMINSWWRPDSYYQQSAWRATWGGEGGGVLVNQAPHQLDLWQWICGIPVKVFSKNINGCHRNIGVENDVTMLVEFANGATGTFTTCTHDAIGTDRLEIDLDGGKIVVDNSKTAHVYHYIDKEGNPCTEDYLNEHMNMMEVAMLTSGNGAGSKLYTEETFENNDGWGFQHTTVMQNFAAHILTGSPLLAPGEAGIARTKDLKNWERLPDLKSRSQQRNVVLHPEFVDGKYALYTRPQDGFINAGSGGGIGWALVDDMTHAEVKEEKIIDYRYYHTIKEVKNGEGPHPVKTSKGWLHLAHGVRACAAGLRYVLYMYMTALDDPTKLIAAPGGYFMAPVGEERIGDVSNVLFTNGWIADEDGKVFIYYASSDTRMHVATSTVDKLVDYCMNTPADGLSSFASVETLKKLIDKNLKIWQH